MTKWAIEDNVIHSIRNQIDETRWDELIANMDTMTSVMSHSLSDIAEAWSRVVARSSISTASLAEALYTATRPRQADMMLASDIKGNSDEFPVERRKRERNLEDIDFNDAIDELL